MDPAPAIPPDSPQFSRTTRRKRIVWLTPIIAGVAPTIAFYVSLSAAERSNPLNHGAEHVVHVLLYPGVLPGLMFRSISATLLAAGIFWYLLFVVLLAALLLPKPPRPRDSEGIYLRPLIGVAILLLVYAALVARVAIGWNPD